MESMQPNVEVRGLPRHAWIIWLVLGLVSVGIGVWLVLSPRAAITTLAILLAIALAFNGISELVTAGDRSRPWFGYLLGAMFLLAGLVVLIRPGKSLWFLAVFVGVSFMITGALQVGFAVADREQLRHWPLLAVLGGLGVVVGILAIVWPTITIFALALLVGIRLIIFGVLQLVVASQLRSLAS